MVSGEGGSIPNEIGLVDTAFRSATRSKILRKQKEGTIYENLVKK